MSSELNLNTINYQNNLRSKPIRENFTDIQNNFNLLRAEVYASIASTASEITTARGGMSALIDNMSVRKIYGYGISTGGVISAAGTPNNTVLFSAGKGICPDGSGVSWVAGTSATVAAVTKPRYGIAVINNDSSFAVEWGATASSPTYPSLASSQLPLATIYQGTASPAVFETSNIVNATQNGFYKKIQFSQTFNASGTFYVPDGVYQVKITMQGGGGNGDSGENAGQVNTGGVYYYTAARGGDGGNAGEKYEKMEVLVTPGDVIPVTIGLAEQSTVFGSYLTARGGSKKYPGSSRGGRGGEPGVYHFYAGWKNRNGYNGESGEDCGGYTGGSGGNGAVCASTTLAGGIGGGGGGGGGAGLRGNGGNGGAGSSQNGSSAPPNSGAGGGGGGGANAMALNGGSGGAGGSGFCIVEWEQ